MNKLNENKLGYKHTPLGWIPDVWEIKDLGDCCLIKGEYGINAPSVPFSDELPTYLRISDIDEDGNFKYNQRKSVKDKNAQKYYLQQGDIVFARTGGTVGKTYIHINENGKLVFAGFLIRFRTDKNKLLPSYLKYYTNTKRYWDWVKVVSMRSGQPGINGAEYCLLPLIIPPINEQLQISLILSTWDDAIAKTKKLILQLQQRYKGLKQNLLTGKKRLMGYKVEWKYLHIHQIAKEVILKNKNRKDLTVLSCTKYDGLVPSLEYFGKRVFGSDISTYKIVPINHFAYATNHIEEGSIGYQNHFDEALISPMYTVFKTDSIVHDDYFIRLLKSHNYIHEYCKRIEGSIDRRGGLRWDEFSKIVINLPEFEEQKAISYLLYKAEAEIQIHEQKIAYLQHQKKGIIQKLLTGFYRVKVSN